MPSLLRMMIRGLQWMGRSKEDCAEYMISGFMSKVQGGFHLLDQYGAETAKPVSLHEEAREFVWDHHEASPCTMLSEIDTVLVRERCSTRHKPTRPYDP